jgi:superfamily II DNA/RNA helicase
MVDSIPPKKEFTKLGKGECETVEQLDLKKTKIRPRAVDYLSKQRTWEDEEYFKIPKDILKGIVEELGFSVPSSIQGFAIPIIAKCENGDYSNIIAQSKNGSGKTGAFSIGSVLRVDPKIQKPQVLVLCHIRELCAQIADVYEKICKFSDITVTNHAVSGKADANIVIMTLGGLKNCLDGKRRSLDLTALRCAVIDEVDYFFSA